MDVILLDAAIFFVGLALMLYSLFGGIALGGGVLELLVGNAGRNVVNRALGPSWEAHHVWLILLVGILLVGFPPIFYALEEHLFIPLFLMAAGIALRAGTVAYRTFLNPGNRSGRGVAEIGLIERIYDRIYQLSSLGATFFLGVTVAAAISGRIDPNPATFYAGYVAPWLNVFSMLVGLFTTCLFSFLAATYSLGEARTEQERDTMARSAKVLTIAAIFSGALVFLAGELGHVYLLSRFAYSPGAIVSVLVSIIVLPFLWHYITVRRIWPARILAGGELVLVLVAWFDVQNPIAVSLKYDANLTFGNSAAAESTLFLLVGVLLAATAVGIALAISRMDIFEGEG